LTGVIRIERLEPPDAELLSKVARRAYSDHFLYLWDDGGEAYIARSFGAESLRTELEDAANLYFVSYYGDEAAGFLKLRADSTLPMFGGIAAFEIERIYLAREFKGKGIGKEMMNTAIGIAESMDKQIVWLKVMDGNDASIKFYENCGFSICGTVVLTLPHIKAEHAGMFVMQKVLSGGS